MIPHANPDKKEEIDEVKIPYDYENAKKVTWYNRVLLNRPLKVIIAILLTAVVMPTMTYKYVFSTSGDWPPFDGHSTGSCLIPRSSRLLCGEGYIPQEACHPQCCYDLDNHICFHRYPSRFSYVMDQEWTEQVTLRPRIATVPYDLQNSVPSLMLSVDEVSATHLSLTFYDPRNQSIVGRRIDNKNYDYQVSSPELNVIVNGLQGTIFDTARGPLIASDNIWEITFQLTNETLYGLGELPLLPGTTKVLYNHNGGLSSIPLIFAKFNGSYHGLLIDGVNPIEVSIGGDHNIVLRSITKSGIKIHLFLGPLPKNIMEDVMSFIESKVKLEYWMLGAHICSETSVTDEAAVTDLQNFLWNSNSLPFDSHCGTKPIVFNPQNDTDVNPIENGARMVTSNGKRFVPHVSPYIHYEGIVDETFEPEINETVTTTEVYMTDTSTDCIQEFQQYMLQSIDLEIYSGVVNNRTVLYPDYETVSDEFMNQLWPYNIDVDGVILENDWPLDESVKNFTDAITEFPYFSENFMTAFKKTPLWNILRPQGEDYIYEHNKYGHNFVDAFSKIYTNISKWSISQWITTEAIVNRQNIDTSWTNLRKELVEAVLGGISGRWLWSSPVCGDTTNFDAETQFSLCTKWYMAATYFPLIKIHSKTTLRVPSVFDGTSRTLMTNALNERSTLSPYFFTVLQEGPLLRPMFYQFPFSEELSDLSNQFSVGPDLLIIPNLQPTQTHVHFSLPPGIWYEFNSGLRLEGDEGDVITMTTTESDFLTFVRGGSIIVTQKEVRPTVEITRRMSPYTVVIASSTIGNSTEETYCAEGKLYMSQNMTLTFKTNATDLIISAVGDDFGVACGMEAVWSNILREIVIYGLNDIENNYDNFKQIITFINLCELENDDIVINIAAETFV